MSLDPEKTPMGLPDITQPKSLMQGIDQIEKSQTRDGFRGLLEDFGYAEDESLDYRYVPYSAMLELEGAVVIIALTDEKKYRMLTLLGPGEVDTADGLLTLRARITLTPTHHFSRRIKAAYGRIHSPKRVREAYDSMHRYRHEQQRDQMRRLLGHQQPPEEEEQPAS